MDWISDPLDRLQWSLWHFLATIFWAVDRLVLIGAVLIHTLRRWITNPGGIIDLVMSSMLQGEGALSLKTFMAGAILLALLLAAFIFILRPLIGSGHSPVDLRKVFLWLALAGYLFSTGGAIFTSMEEFRSQLSSSAYQIAASVNSSVGGAGGGGYNNTQGEVPLNSSQPFSPTVQLFPNTTHIYQGTQEYTGIDVAAAYMFATQEDVNGTNNGGTGLPAGFEAQYFTNDGTLPWPSNYNSDQRQAALNKAVTGVIRMGTGIVPSIFAIQQAIIFLALALAAAIIIFSLPIALVFAFFTATEVITLSVLRAYIALLVKTYVTAMILAIFMGFLKFWADSQNWVAFLGMSLLITYFTLQLAHMAVATITQSLNVVTQAIGQATGTSAPYFDPIKMAGQSAGLAATVGIAAATGGSSLAAGSLISGMGEMGMSVPGMRTLGIGMAVRGPQPGQIAANMTQAGNAGNTTNSPGAPAPVSGTATSAGNNQAPSTPQQPTPATPAATPIPPTVPLPRNTPAQPPSPNAQPAPVATPTGTPATAPASASSGTVGTHGPGTSPAMSGSAPLSLIGTQLLPRPTATGNGSHKAHGQRDGAGTSGTSDTSREQTPSQPSASTLQSAEYMLPSPQEVAEHQSSESVSGEAIEAGAPSDEAPASYTLHAASREPRPPLEGFAGLPPFVRVRPISSRDTEVVSGLADLMRAGGQGEMPQPLQNFSRSTQVALAEIAGKGYSPDEVGAVAGAVGTVVSRMQLQKMHPTTISKHFLGADGTLDLTGYGVRETLKEAGTYGTAWSAPSREADLRYVVGAGLQLEKSYHAHSIRAAIGRAVEEGGSADTAADHLEISPSAAWGGRYGSVQSAIDRSPAFGLTRAEDVQHFFSLAQQRSLEELVSREVTGLAPEQQLLLDTVRARASEMAAENGDTGPAAGQAVLQSYLRDVRNVPGRVTGPVIPGVPSPVNGTHNTSNTAKEEQS